MLGALRSALTQQGRCNAVPVGGRFMCAAPSAVGDAAPRVRKKHKIPRKRCERAASAAPPPS